MRGWLPTRGGQVGAGFLQFTLQAGALTADVAQFARAAAQFELRHDVPGQDAQGLLLLGAQFPRDLINHAQGPQGVTVGRNEAAGYFYCVMELAEDVVAGSRIHPPTYSPRTLRKDQDRLERLPVAECVRLGAAIASALGFLHKHGLIHRDIKPSNIIFVNGIPKLADIGLVTDASEGRSFVGTEGFIAPEGSGTIRAHVSRGDAASRHDDDPPLRLLFKRGD